MFDFDQTAAADVDINALIKRTYRKLMFPIS